MEVEAFASSSFAANPEVERILARNSAEMAETDSLFSKRIGFALLAISKYPVSNKIAHPREFL
jgi:hypothetical protein